MQKGPLFIVSGPSGSGKSTVIERVLRQSDVPLRVSVSATTRPARPYEIDGTHYHFWSRERFVKERDEGAFLEWAEVHGQCYGTPWSEVEPYRMRGMGVVLDIDVQGADQVRRVCPESVTVFLRAASFREYEQRLKGRGEDAASIARRLETARRELERAKDYQYQIVNEDLDVATRELLAIVHRYFPRETHA
jgi:guanylate kinase